MPKTKKELRLLVVFTISSCAMIGSCIFILPGLDFAQSGPTMILAYLLAAILIFPTMLAKAELQPKCRTPEEHTSSSNAVWIHWEVYSAALQTGIL